MNCCLPAPECTINPTNIRTFDFQPQLIAGGKADFIGSLARVDSSIVQAHVLYNKAVIGDNDAG